MKAKPLPKVYKNVQQSKENNWLVRCPACGRENYGPAVPSGVCVWCGWEEARLDDHKKDGA